MRIRPIAAIAAPIFALGLGACEVQQRSEGQLPEVEVQEGQLPEYDVDTGELEIQEDTQVITVPDPEVQMPNEQ